MFYQLNFIIIIQIWEAMAPNDWFSSVTLAPKTVNKLNRQMDNSAHHHRYKYCRTRPRYRAGRQPTAVKVRGPGNNPFCYKMTPRPFPDLYSGRWVLVPGRIRGAPNQSHERGAAKIQPLRFARVREIVQRGNVIAELWVYSDLHKYWPLSCVFN